MRWALRGGEQSIGRGMGDVGDPEASLAILCLMGLLSRVNPTLSGPWSSWNSDLGTTLVVGVDLIVGRRPPSSQIFALWARDNILLFHLLCLETNFRLEFLYVSDLQHYQISAFSVKTWMPVYAMAASFASAGLSGTAG